MIDYKYKWVSLSFVSKNTIALFLLCAGFLCSSNSYAALRYWVVTGPGPNIWNNTANWSTFSGGPGGSSVPGVLDVAIFVATANGNCTIDIAVNVLGMQIGGYNGNIIQNNFALTIGSFGFSQNSGTYTGDAANIDINSGEFILSGGTFISSSGILFIGGTRNSGGTLFTYSAGTFNHNNGTVRIDPDFTECAQRTATLSSPATVTFYNLIIDVDNQSCTEDIFAVSGVSSVIVENDFTQFDGFVNTGTVEVRGDVYLEGGADGGTATILMNDPVVDQTYNNASAARFAHLRVNKAAGSVNPGIGTTDFLVQQFTLDAGTFNAPTGSFNVGGVWTGNPTLFTYSAGTFNHNNGTVRFDPDFTECALRTATIDAAIPLIFNNLIVDVDNQSCTEDVLTITGSTTLSILNDLTLFDGSFNTVIMQVQGNVTVVSGFDGGTGSLQFSGGNPQNFDLAGATGNFNGDITINKSSNNVTLLSSCLLDAAAQDLTLTSGLLISTATNLLIIGDNVNVTGASINSYVSGPIQKTGNDAFTFSTGKAGIYSSIRISAPALITDAFTAEYFVANPTGAGYDISVREPIVTDVSSCDYWILNRTTGTSNVQATLTWNRATGCYGFSNTNILVVARWDGAQWTNAGVTATTDSGLTGTVTSAVISSFSPLAVASTSVPLPIELVYFKANWINEDIALDWRTASELNNDYFTIERSVDGIEFAELARVKGQGTKPSETTYQYMDEQPLIGRSYYRLRQTDFDNKFTFSNIVMAEQKLNQNPEVSVYPNPVDAESLRIQLKGYKPGDDVMMRLTDIMGREIITHSLSVDSTGSKEIEINRSRFTSGVFLITVTKGWSKTVAKIVIK